MASGSTKRKPKLMPWEPGGEPEYAELPKPDPEAAAELDAFFRARDRGYMTDRERWMCVLKAHEVRSGDGKIYRY